MVQAALKIVKWAYYKYLRPKLEEYVQDTSNQWDDKALLFLDEVIDLVLTRLGVELVVKLQQIDNEVATMAKK